MPVKKTSALFCLLCSQTATADLLQVFREADGHTNWQYVANFSSSVLILALSYTAVRLYFSRRQSQRYNLQLEEIRTQLELRVKERTATLDESNSLLKTSNKALEEEIAEHRNTTSRLRRSESYINSILRSMPLMLIGLNKQNQITQWNHLAEEISGISSDTALGQDLWQTYPTITVTPQQIEQARDDNKILTIKYSQRGHYYFDITIYPLQEQIETGVVILVDNVTQRVKSENMLIQRDKMSSMGEMASVMAHDINGPLRAIIKDVKTVRTSLTDTPVDTEGLCEILEDAVIRGQQATSIIDNLIAFSGSGGGAKTTVDIKSVINHSIELASDVLSVTSGLRFRDVEITTDFADDIPDIPCYITEMQQVLLSLFRHACQALGDVDAEDHRPTIHTEVSQSYDNLWIRVRHNGVGISIEDQKIIFEPFEGNANSQYDAGERLSFSYFIITEQHQGQIAVTCSAEVGTTFHIQLPIK